MAQAGVNQIRDFFGMSTKELKDEWVRLSSEEKEYFKTAVGEALGLEEA